MGEKIGENGELMTDIHQVMYYVVIIWNSGRLVKIANEEMEKHIPSSGTDYLTKLNR